MSREMQFIVMVLHQRLTMAYSKEGNTQLFTGFVNFALHELVCKLGRKQTNLQLL